MTSRTVTSIVKTRTISRYVAFETLLKSEPNVPPKKVTSLLYLATLAKERDTKTENETASISRTVGENREINNTKKSDKNAVLIPSKIINVLSNPSFIQ